DDQLGVFGDPAVTGKPSGDDLRTGKRTVLVNTAFAECSPEQLARLREDFGPLPGAAEHTAEQIDGMRQIIQDCGAAQQIEDKINALSERAISLVEDSWLEDSISEELVAFARLLSDRRF
ncbi:polyprenyl synthetase family protein, partial [Klebsiella pneumoniae]